MLFNKSLIIKTISLSEKSGIRPALKNLFYTIGVRKINVTGTIPKNGPLLIISNHTGVFDSLLLMGFLIREDLYFIALATYRIFGNTIRRKLLPIFRISKINHKIYEYPLCLQINKNLPRLLSINDIQKQNRETVNKAAKLINKGHAVIIFPGGGAGKKLPDSLWKIGLGYLVKMIKNRKTQIVYVNIKGTKMRDITGFFTPLLSKVLFRPPEIHIHILNKFNLVKLINSKMSEKEIVRKLERKYLSLLN